MTKATAPEPGLSLSHARMMVCLEAAWEIDALARALPGQVPNIEECMAAGHVVRGISGRLLRLAFVLMSGLGDDAQPTAKLEKVITFDGGQG